MARHVFAVENLSMGPWTIATISRSCVCTVATTTAAAITPGRTEEFEVVYRAGGTSADFEQSAEVRFSEPEAPAVVFRGRVRRPLTVIPSELRFGPIRSNEEASAWLEVENHSGAAWSDVTAAELPAWLHVRGQAVRVAGFDSSDGTNAPERWRVEFVAASGDLPPIAHREEMVVKASSASGEFTERLPAELRVIAPFQIVPSQLFLGTVAPGESVRKQVVFTFPNAADCPADMEQAAITHDLKHDLSFQWRRISPDAWALTVEFRASATERPSSGAVRIALPDSVSASLVLPVNVWVRPAEATR